MRDRNVDIYEYQYKMLVTLFSQMHEIVDTIYAERSQDMMNLMAAYGIHLRDWGQGNQFEINLKERTYSLVDVKRINQSPWPLTGFERITFTYNDVKTILTIHGHRYGITRVGS